MGTLRNFALQLATAAAVVLAARGRGWPRNTRRRTSRTCPTTPAKTTPPIRTSAARAAQQTADLGSGYRPVRSGPAQCQILTAQQAPIGVMNSYSQGVAAAPDSGAVPPATVPASAAGGCSSCRAGGGGGIPANSQMVRFQLSRIWRSTWTHDGSLGTGMYLNYDYYVTHSTSLIEFRDPNTGYIERFIPSGGTSTAWIPGPA